MQHLIHKHQQRGQDIDYCPNQFHQKVQTQMLKAAPFRGHLQRKLLEMLFLADRQPSHGIYKQHHDYLDHHMEHQLQNLQIHRDLYHQGMLKLIQIELSIQFQNVFRFL